MNPEKPSDAQPDPEEVIRQYHKAVNAEIDTFRKEHGRRGQFDVAEEIVQEKRREIGGNIIDLSEDSENPEK